MRCLLLIFLIVATAVAAPAEENEIAKKIHVVHEKCQKEVPLSEDVLEKIRKHETVDPLPENFGAHMLCMGKGMGTITEDGKVNKEKLKQRMESVSGQTEEKVQQILDECTKNYETPEKTAIELGKCVSSHTKLNEHHH